MNTSGSDIQPTARFDHLKERQRATGEALGRLVGRRVGRRPQVTMTAQDPILLQRLIRYRSLDLYGLGGDMCYSSYESLRRRLRRLTDSGLIHTRPWSMGRQIYMPSARALVLAGLEPVRPANGAALLEHRLAIASLGLYWAAVLKREVLTEFEITSDPHSMLFKRVRFGQETGATTHRPDMVIREPGSPLVRAIEVELTQKSRERLDKVMFLYYKYPELYDRITYICTSASIARAVDQASRRLGLTHVVSVEHCPPWWDYAQT